MDGAPAGPGLDVGALFEEHGARILAFTRSLLGNLADAEDATQETFLRAHRAAGTFAAASAPSTWLYAIARNACLDRLRAGERRTFAGLEEVLAAAAPGGAAAGSTAGVEAGVEAGTQWRWYVDAVREGCLLGTLACLTADQRAAFVLRTVCGLSCADAAVVLGRSENAVRVLTHRARRALTSFLCRNCSVYDPANPCRCRNLVGFSLARGWIGPDDRRLTRRDAAAVAERAAGAIDEVARLADVYACLTDPQPRPALAARIRSALRALDAAGRDPGVGGPAETTAETSGRRCEGGDVRAEK
jgi:RNA polymerase sigma factor (sigma-70 family)